MKINRKSIIFNSLFFISFLLNFLNLKLYEETIIRIEIIAALYGIGILTFLMINRILKKISPWNNFNNLIFYLLVLGSFLTTSILGINYYFSEKKTENKTYKILRKTEIIGSKYNRSKKIPAVIIETEKDYTKRIEFSRNLKYKVDKSSSIKLTLSKGLFNFYIIRNKQIE